MTLWTYLWPAFAAALVVGLIGGIFAFRRPRHNRVRAISLVVALGLALLWHGPLGGGGRVLAVTAIADTLANARARAYRAVDEIDYADGFHRRDIGWRELERTR